MPMIDLPSRRSALNGPRADMAYIAAIMSAPSTPEKASELLDASRMDDSIRRLEIIDNAGLVVDLPSDYALAMRKHTSPRERLWPELADDRLAFIATGYVLRWIVSRSMRPGMQNEATINSAASSVHKWLVTNKLSGGSSSDTVKRQWRKYRCVSHLWAAWQILGQADIDHGTAEGFQQFLATAQWLLNQGSLIVPIRDPRRESVLSKDNAWQVPADCVSAPWAVIWPDDLDAHDIRKLPAPDWCKTG